MSAADRIACQPPSSISGDSSLRRAARLLLRAEELGRQGCKAEASQRLGEAARALFAASARDALVGLCRRVRLLEEADPERDRELAELASGLGAEAEGDALRMRLATAEEKPEPPSASARSALHADDEGDEQGDEDWEQALRGAVALRRSGRSAQAIGLLRGASRKGSRGELHREWSFALLEQGDLSGALGHAQKWCHLRPGSVGARLWLSQLLWKEGRRREAWEARRQIEGSLEGEHVASAAGRLLEQEEALVWGVAGPPWWFVEADREDGAEPEVDAELSGEPLVWLDREDHFFRLPLTRILTNAGFGVARSAGYADAVSLLERTRRVPAACLVHFEEPAAQGIATLRELRRHPGLRHVPIVAITTLERRGVDLASLRELGVVGVLDKRMIPEDVVDRLQRILGADTQGRRFARAPAYFPVDLEAEGATTTEYARNLSVGGLGLVTSRRVAANTDVKLRFRLKREALDVEIAGRVIYSRVARGGGDFDLGLFFYALDAPVRAALEREVAHRLAASARRGAREAPRHP